jgi:hypothetical protein
VTLAREPTGEEKRNGAPPPAPVTHEKARAPASNAGAPPSVEEAGAAPEPSSGVAAKARASGGEGEERRAPGDDLPEELPTWEHPWRFEDDADRLPGFPIQTLPSWLGNWAKSTSEFLQVPTDMVVAISLAVIATAAQRKWCVEVRSGYREPLCLWIVVGAFPGERKSAAFGKATKPLNTYQDDERERLIPEIADRNRRRRIIEGKIKSAEKKAEQDPVFLDEARDLDAQLKALPAMFLPQLIMGDVTPEACAQKMAENSETMAVLSAEGEIFSILSGRYSDQVPNMEFFLAGHAGDPYTVNRISRDDLRLQYPRLTLGVCVQPDVISSLASKPAFRTRGLIGRILYCLPPSRLGFRLPNPPVVPEGIAEAYEKAIVNLLAEFDSKVDPGVIRVLKVNAETDTDAVRTCFFEEIEALLKPGAVYAEVKDWAGKLPGATARIAGLLHLSEHAMNSDAIPPEISATTYTNAAIVGRYFADHSMAAFTLMESDENDRLALRIWKRIQRLYSKGKCGEKFSIKDVQRTLKVKGSVFTTGRVSAAEIIRAALDRLEDRCLVDEILQPRPPPGAVPRGRPKSPEFRINFNALVTH